MSVERVFESDLLVIGGGMAGSFAAVKAKELGLDIILVEKAYAGRSGSTHYSEGDLTFFDIDRGHDSDAWLEVASKRCEYLNNREWGEIVLKDAHARYEDLVSWGVKFYEEDGEIIVNRSYGGRSKEPAGMENVCMVNREYAPVLRKKVLESGVRLMDRIMVCELLKQDGRVVGAVGFHTISGNLYVFKAKAIIIASGSSSFKTGNANIHYWTSDGEAMAYRAGAEITGKEFWTRAYWADRAFYKKQEQAGERPVDVGDVDDTMARFPFFRPDGGGIWQVPTINAEGGPVMSPVWEAHCGRAPVYIDLDALTPDHWKFMEFYYQRLGTEEVDKTGFDITEPRGGKVQYSPGGWGLTMSHISGGGSGIWPIDTNCATALPGLYAAGNSCATRACGGAGYAGLGWGLNHAAVTGTRAGFAAAEYATKSKKMAIDEAEMTRVKQIVCSPVERKGGFSPDWLTQVLRGFSVPYFLLWIKHGERLQAALTIVEFVNNHLVPKLMAKDPHEWRKAQEAKNMVLSLEMVLRASLFRTESRGGHFREDYPGRDDPTWLAWVKLKNEEDRIKVSKEPIPKQWWPDLMKPYEERYSFMFPGE